MSVNPKNVALFIPAGLKKFKTKLFEGIGERIVAAGGMVVRSDPARMDGIPDNIWPIIGCTPYFRPFVAKWRARGRNFITWDRGYARRVFATWLPNGNDLGVPGGYYRWHVNSFQMRSIRNVPDDRWKALKIDTMPWKKSGERIVIADTGPDYWDLHASRTWVKDTAALIAKHTSRPIFIRDKESKVPLAEELADAHCLVTHGSIAAVEAVVMGCPVFVDTISAAALVGRTDFASIEDPIYPERQAWLNSLAYCQFNESELVDGTLWRLIN